jgi:RNA polymerase sigma-70 factor, ECF subfamily
MTADVTRQLADARAGDPAVLGRLLEGYRNYLRLLARVEIGRRLQGKVDPSDVIQEVFLDAHRYFPTFRGTGEAQFAHWLREILAGTLANTVRRYLGTKARDVRLERGLAADVDRSSVALAGLLLVAEALGRLPDDYQTVLVLRHLEGLTFPQVAVRMGRSVDSVEKLWLRGLTQLRKAFGRAGRE